MQVMGPTFKVRKKMSSTMTSIICFLFLSFCSTFTIATSILCATLCECENIEDNGVIIADCSRVYLAIVPPVDDWPVNVTHMDLNSNNISSLDVGMTHDFLQVLDLSHNNIQNIVQYAFDGLKDLRYLNLASNLIKTLHENTFYGLQYLESLNLSSNLLETLPDNIFYSLNGLQELSLASNPLVHIDPIHFNRLINLRWLDLSNIDGYSLAPNLYHTAAQLEFLDLSDNDYHDVPTDALRSAKKLRHLRMNENPIETLDRKSFVRLSSLEILELNYMENLKEIGERTFTDLVRLHTLEMKYNRRLKHINALAFEGLFNETRPTLQELDLEGNEISSFRKGNIQCAKMRKFNLQKNPLNCDCNLKWIKECQIQQVYAADLRCKGPADVAGALIIDLSEDDFHCEYYESEMAHNFAHHERVVRSVSAGLGVALLLMLALGIAFVFKWRDLKEWYKSRRGGQGAVYYVRARSNPREI